jgi:hypothetical protein
MPAQLRSRILSRTALAAVVFLLSGSVRPLQTVRAQESDMVVAQSRFGHGQIEGKTRETPRGLQVQLPGGTWVYCRRSCSETLRVETIDFFESNGSGPVQPGQSGFDAECGIFGCLDLKYPR